MNGLTENIDFSPIVGLEIGQICFGAWTVIINFDGPVKIVIESNIILSTRGGELRAIQNYRAEANALCNLVGLIVSKVYRTPSGGMKLSMSSGTDIEVTNSSTQYESFQIHIGNQVFVA